MANQLRLRDERANQVIEVWKAIVGVQQHFNDIGMRIRSMFVTILLGLFAAIGFLLDKKPALDVGTWSVQFATLIPLFGMFGTGLFYFIDRYWYHRLLIGAVKHAISIEKKYKKQLPELSLSDAIGAESPYKPQGLALWAARRLVRHDKFKENGLLHSDGKIELFYKSVIAALFATFVILLLFGGFTIRGKSLMTLTTSVASTALTAPSTPPTVSSPPAAPPPPPSATAPPDLPPAPALPPVTTPPAAPSANTAPPPVTPTAAPQ